MNITKKLLKSMESTLKQRFGSYTQYMFGWINKDISNQQLYKLYTVWLPIKSVDCWCTIAMKKTVHEYTEPLMGVACY